MKKTIHYIILSIFFIGFATHLFAASQVSISHIKEPKIIFDEPKKEVKTQQINNELVQNEVIKTKTLKEAEITKELSKNVIVEPKESEKKLAQQQEASLIIPDDKIEQKQNIELLKQEKEKVTAEAPKKVTQNSKHLKNEPIALVFASRTIGKYAVESSNVAMTYLVNKNSTFQLEMIDIQLETKDNITKALDILNEKGIKKVIFLVTSTNIWGLNSYPEIAKFDIYLPLVHKSTVANPKANYIFGGMDYKNQFKFLTSKASSHIVEIYDESSISKSLHDELVKLNIPNIKYIQLIGKNPNYNPLFLRSNKIKNATVILNTSIVKSAIILSLLRGNDVNPKETFATQLNYSPVIFNLTQIEDRERLFVANSIELLPRDVEELISFFGEDVVYNWVNYATIVGLEYFMTNNKKLFGNIEIKENQVNYPVKLFGFEGTKFVESKR